MHVDGKPHHRKAKAKLLAARFATYTCTLMFSVTHLERQEAASTDIFRDVVAEPENRAIDEGQSASMEDKKQEGYF